jgi:hypothetical protein
VLYVLTAWSWLVDHHEAVMLALGAFVGMLRAIPAPTWQAFERDWPRVANLARLLRAIAPDFWKAAKVVLAMLSGKPWPSVPQAPVPVVHESAEGESGK